MWLLTSLPSQCKILEVNVNKSTAPSVLFIYTHFTYFKSQHLNHLSIFRATTLKKHGFYFWAQELSHHPVLAIPVNKWCYINDWIQSLSICWVKIELSKTSELMLKCQNSAHDYLILLCGVIIVLLLRNVSISFGSIS